MTIRRTLSSFGRISSGRPTRSADVRMLGMVVVDSPPANQVFSAALDALQVTHPPPVSTPALKWDPTSRPGDEGVCGQGTTPYHITGTDAAGMHWIDALTCYKNVDYLPTNAVPYFAPGGAVGPAFWQEAVAHAAASFYQHTNPGKTPPSDPAILQPWIDRANAWFWGVRPYVLGGGALVQLLGGGSSANQLPWNEVPWGGIPEEAWTWLRAHDPHRWQTGPAHCAVGGGWDPESGACVSRIDWHDVRSYLDSLTMMNPTPNADSADVDWMAVIPNDPGFDTAPAAWLMSWWGSRVPWAMPYWTDIPWTKIPWALIDWPTIHSTEDLKHVLETFAATGSVTEPSSGGMFSTVTPQYGLTYTPTPPPAVALTPTGTLGPVSPIGGPVVGVGPGGSGGSGGPATGWTPAPMPLLTKVGIGVGLAAAGWVSYRIATKQPLLGRR